MWVSEYPHFDAEFPDTAEVIVMSNPRLSADENRATLAHNALRFFRPIAA